MKREYRYIDRIEWEIDFLTLAVYASALIRDNFLFHLTLQRIPIQPQTVQHSVQFVAATVNTTVDRDCFTFQTLTSSYCVAHFQSFDQNFLACLPCLLYFHRATIRM